MRIFLAGKSLMNKPDRWITDLFARAFERHHDVIYYGKRYTIDYNNEVPVPEMLKRYRQKIDLVIVHFGFSFNGMERVTDIPKVHFLSDYGFAGAGIVNYEGYDKYLRFQKYDMVIGYTPSVCGLLKERKIPSIIRYLPTGVDTYVFHDKGLPRDIDVMAGYSRRSSRYPHRKDVIRLIKTMGIKYFVNRVPTWTYIDILNRSKMFANANPLSNAILPKCLEAMACGTMLLTEKSGEMDLLGYVNGEHLVTYDGMDDLKDKIWYYLEHEDERNEIAKKGMEFVREKYSNDKVVERFTGMVMKNLFGGKAR